MGCCQSKEHTSKADNNGSGYDHDAPTVGTNSHHQTYQHQQPPPMTQPHNVSAPQTKNPPARPRPRPQPQPRPQAQAQPPQSKAQAQPRTRPVLEALPPNAILGKPFDDIKRYYTLGKELGRGQFGITYLCTENSTGHSYACKSILKRKLIKKSDRDDVKREIQIMQHLSGQPNIVEFKGAFEDTYSVHLVMELCAGLELFDRITAQGHYSERAAAGICRAIVNVVHICNFMGVMHRDLKPENFLFSSKDEHAMLKAADFGLSVFIEEGDFYAFLRQCAYIFLLTSFEFNKV